MTRVDFTGFLPGFRHPTEAEGPAHWFVFREGKMLVRIEEGMAAVPRTDSTESLGVRCGKVHFLGTAEGIPCLAAEAEGAEGPADGWRFEGLRALFGAVPESLFHVAGRAVELLGWDAAHGFCGRCGTPLSDKTEERAKSCPSCGRVEFPKFSAAIIVAVVRDGKILLARKPQFAPGLFGVVAGFVEAGESLEECVRREVREETGVEVTDIRYAGSQHWPFPDSLMIGFLARHAGGEIAVDGREIGEAHWYAPDALPDLPHPFSIARKLIERFKADEEARRNRP